MDKIFNTLPGVFCFVDDILVAGKNEKAHQDRLIAVLSRIKENGKIHKDKCLFQISSLGFRLNKDGINEPQGKSSEGS